MFTLQNETFKVSILDPIADKDRCGTRYNTGGFIFQIDDAQQIGATSGYMLGLFPIWGNPVTFSREPYYENTLAPGLETSWWIDYEF